MSPECLKIKAWTWLVYKKPTGFKDRKLPLILSHTYLDVMGAESRTETILIAFKEAIRNGVPVMAHGSCRASQFWQLEANRRNLLNSFTLCKGLLVFPKVTWSIMVPNVSQLQNNIHVQRQDDNRSIRNSLEVESRSVYILATDDPPGRITWNTSQRWTSLTSSMMRSRVSCMLMACSPEL